MWNWVHVKRLREGDEPSLRKLISIFKPGDETEHHTNQLLGHKDVHLLSAISSEDTIGFLLAYELPRLSTAEKMMFIYELEVTVEHRRKGVGRLLLEAVLTYSHLQGFSKAFVITEESNKAALNLYLSSGGISNHDDDAVIRFDTRSG
jgi:ribosomal protein S18 acetylase RimI-like enzyme